MQTKVNNNDNNNDDRFSLFLSVYVKHMSASVVAKHTQDDAQIESIIIIIIIMMHPPPPLSCSFTVLDSRFSTSSE